MGRILSIIAVLGFTLFLGACAGGEPKHAELTPLTQISSLTDPGDDVLRQSIREFLAGSGAPASSLYSFQRQDLNHDGRRDALVIFKNPYGYWCGLYGCTMLVLQASDDDFKVISSVQPVREPLYVSDHQTNGWDDIIVHVSGRWTETKDVAMQFDGSQYPNNPDSLPACVEVAEHGTRLFYD